MTLEIQRFAMESLMQGMRNNTLGEIVDFFGVYKKKFNKELSPKDVAGLDLSFQAVYAYFNSVEDASSFLPFIESAPEFGFLNDDQLAKTIEYFPNIKRLEIGCESGDIFTQIAGSAQQLEDLDVFVSDPTEKLCAFIKKIANLRYLNLYKGLGGEPIDIRELAPLKNLEHLTYSGDQVLQSDLQALAHLKLKHFDIRHCTITDFSVIPNFGELESLGFDYKGISEKQLDILSSHEHLQRLSVCGKISKTALKKLTKIKNLKVLKINSEIIPIPVPYDQKVISVWRTAVSFVRSNPVESGLLAGGVVVSWPFTGALCALIHNVFIRK